MTRRIAIVTAILLVSGGLRWWLAASPTIPPHRPLADFPSQLGNWRAVGDTPITPEVLEVLKADDYLLRTYRNRNADVADLFMAYYRAQRAGEAMHSPKNCLPGAGWVPVQNDEVSLGFDSNGSDMRVNHYVVQKGEDKALVLYWYQEQGRIIASEYWGKIFLVWDGLRTGRRDGAIVRVTMPISRQQSPAESLEDAMDLARRSLIYMPQFIPGKNATANGSNVRAAIN